MGSQVGELGQKEHRPFILRHLRDRRGLCGLVSISSELAEHADSRFCQVRSGTKANGGTAPTGSLINLATQVSNATEVKWLRALRDELKESFHGPRIDLLEVYAQPNSRLAEEVVKQGGKAERFTREHGDLSIFAGQLELLRMVTRLRPKHVWVAPECAPWCSWNRFNALRSTQAFDRIDHAQEQSREHLSRVFLILKLLSLKDAYGKVYGSPTFPQCEPTTHRYLTFTYGETYEREVSFQRGVFHLRYHWGIGFELLGFGQADKQTA